MESTPLNWLSLPKVERQQRLRQYVAHQTQTDYVELVRADGMGVYASLGVHFDYAIFGRDSLQVAEDLLMTHKDLVQAIIITMANLQGIKTDLRSEEELGKIHHEFRSKTFAGKPIPQESLDIINNLQKIWGVEGDDSLCYYGSYDATPLFIRLLGNYEAKYGPEFLFIDYDSKLGQKRIGDSLRTAVEWLVGKIESSEWNLFEYKRLNLESGIANQAWKDSGTSYLHRNGEVANFDGGVASIELQGLAYDALKVGARLVAKDENERQKWLDLAAKIQQQTITNLWMEDQKYFAQGLDRAEDGKMRKIDTLTSNPGALLDSSLLLDLEPEERQKYVDAVVSILTGSDFMTDAGIRCRALTHKDMPGFVDYHGSYTVWPKETYSIAKGLRRHGNVELAVKLEATITDSVTRAGEFDEFFYVNGDGNVWYDRDEAIEHFKTIGLGENIAVPEPGQAWTISAVQAILSSP